VMRKEGFLEHSSQGLRRAKIRAFSLSSYTKMLRLLLCVRMCMGVGIYHSESLASVSLSPLKW